ncbi:MAG: hypothetical protein M3535_10265 [Actinomycetota bacterium]|nr:hypothetical protein [Actinomycetota bacterium]
MGATLGLVAAAGFGVIIFINSVPPERSFEPLGFPLVWSMPALLALLSLRSRPVLLLPAGVLSVFLAVTALSGVTLVLLVPMGFYVAAYRRQRWYPSTLVRPLLAMVIPVVAAGVAVVALMANPDPVCWSYVEGGDGQRAYTRTPCQQMSERAPAMAVPPPADDDSGSASGSGSVFGGSAAAGGGSTSDTVTLLEAATSAALVAGGLTAVWILSAPGAAGSSVRPTGGPPGPHPDDPPNGADRGSRPGRSRPASPGW